MRETGAGKEYLEAERAEQLALLRERRAAYTPGRPPADPTGRRYPWPLV